MSNIYNYNHKKFFLALDIEKKSCYSKKAKRRIFLNSSAVEHSAVNRTVAGSNPAWGVFLWLVGQVVKTRPFHGCNRGSNPLRVIFWRHSQVVRQRSAKPLCISSNLIGALVFNRPRSGNLQHLQMGDEL